MIAKIVTGASFGGCTAYAYGKDKAEVISHDGIIPDDPKIAAKCFEIQSQLNPRVSKPVGHIAISFKPEDKPKTILPTNPDQTTRTTPRPPTSRCSQPISPSVSSPLVRKRNPRNKTSLQIRNMAQGYRIIRL